MYRIKKVSILVFFIVLMGCTKSPLVEQPSIISREEIHFLHNRTQIDFVNYTWIYFNTSETESMYPTIRKTSHAIGLQVDDNTLVHVDDIVFFHTENKNYVHRVVEKGIDGKGEFFITKGDNNEKKDNVKLRKSDLSYIVAAIIY